MERTEIIPPEVRASGFAGEEIRAEIERNTAIAAKERKEMLRHDPEKENRK